MAALPEPAEAQPSTQRKRIRLQETRNGIENQTGPRGLEEASLLPRRRCRRALAARRPLHRVGRLMEPAAAQGRRARQARRRAHQALDGAWRAADRPRAALPRPGRHRQARRPLATRRRPSPARRRRNAWQPSRRRRTTLPRLWPQRLRRLPPKPLPSKRLSPLLPVPSTSSGRGEDAKDCPARRETR